MATSEITRAQVKMIRSLAHGRRRLGWSDEEYHRWLRERGGPASTLELTRTQAANVIDMLAAMAFGRKLPVWHVDQATVLQQREIWRLVRRLPAGTRLSGVLMQATHARVDRVAQLRIWEARNVIQALADIVNRGRGPRARSAANSSGAAAEVNQQRIAGAVAAWRQSDAGGA